MKQQHTRSQKYLNSSTRRRRRQHHTRRRKYLNSSTRRRRQRTEKKRSTAKTKSSWPPPKKEKHGEKRKGPSERRQQEDQQKGNRDNKRSKRHEMVQNMLEDCKGIKSIANIKTRQNKILFTNRRNEDGDIEATTKCVAKTLAKLYADKKLK